MKPAFSWILISFLFVPLNLLKAQVIQQDLSNINTRAGGGTAGFTNGNGTSARFNYPFAITADTFGNLFVADYNNHAIRKVGINAPYTVSTLAGSGAAGNVLDTGANARFNGPSGLVCDLEGNVYVADQFNHQIKRIAPNGAVTLIAGSGQVGSANGITDSARFNFPSGVTRDLAGNIFVADQYNHCIRKISAGVVTTLAGLEGVSGLNDGLGSAARFNLPYAISTDGAGNLYVADKGNHAIRKIDAAGNVTTLAGNGTAGFLDGAGANARFSQPFGIFANGLGEVYVADNGNHAIRKVGANGMVATLAGKGNYQLQDASGFLAGLGGPTGVCMDKTGTLWNCEGGTQTLRSFSGLNLPVFQTQPTVPGSIASFSFTARNLSAPVTVNAPAHFEVAPSQNGPFTSSYQITPINNSVFSTVYFRINSPVAITNTAGNIDVASSGANTLSVAVSGTVACPISGFNKNYLKDAIKNQPYSHSFSVYSLNNPKWKLTAGTLPKGLSLDSTNGLLSGTPDSTGVFNFSIRATAFGICFTESQFSMMVVDTPYARFGYFQNNCSNRQVVFYDSSLLATSYFWDFGDGTTSTQQNPVKTYARDSAYWVTLTVNGFSVYEQPVWVFSNPPTAVLTPVPDCSFEYSFTGAPQSIYYTYQWTFNNGVAASATNQAIPRRRYQNTDTAWANLQMVSGGRCTTEVAVSKFVPVVYNKTVVASFTLSAPANNWCGNSRIITNTSTTGLSAYTYSLNGSAFQPIGSALTLNNLNNGAHRFTLAAHNGVCFDTSSLEFYIGDMSGDFAVEPSACNSSVLFTPSYQTQDGLRPGFQWTFGNPLKGSSNGELAVFNFGTAGADSAYLLLTARSGCQKTIAKPVLVQGGSTPVPTFTTQTGTCTNTLQFTNTTNNGSSAYYWNFGEGAESWQTHASRSFADTGWYLVTLVAYQPGCTTYNSAQVRINPGAFGTSASFNANLSAQNINTNNFAFINTSKYVGLNFIDKYYWNFGDGTQDSSTFVFNKIYRDTGTFLVRLVASSPGGCRDTTYRKVRVNPILVARFSLNQPSCSSRAVVFTDSSMLATSWLWEFGDGDTSTQQNPTHTYPKDTVYFVTLTVNGIQSTGKFVDISSFAPQPTLSYQVNCSFTYTFNPGISSPNYNYYWSFSGGTGLTDTTIERPRRVYSVPGPTSADLVVFNRGRCPVTATQLVFSAAVGQSGFTNKARLEAPGANVCDSSRILINEGAGADFYLWQLDGITGDTLFAADTLWNIPAGNHVVSVIGFKGLCRDTVFIPFNISRPIPNFATQANTCNRQVKFINQSVSTDLGALTYAWSFGKPQQGTSIGVNPEFTFALSGIDTVLLTATSANGCVVSTEKAISINPGAGPYPAFTTSKPQAGCGNHVKFTNTTAGNYKYVWSFGDSTISDLKNPSHGFADTGWYLVRLFAYDSLCNGSFESYVHIDSGATGAVARFAVNQESQPFKTHSFDFYNQSANVGPTWNVQYTWIFEDGTIDSSTSSYFAKKFAAIGNQRAMLKVRAANGCLDTFTRVVNTYPVLAVNYGYTKTCANRTVNFHDSSVLATKYRWNFGDGDTSSLASPVHTFARDSFYDVSLTINDSLTLTTRIAVFTTPAINAVTAIKACNNSYTFTGAVPNSNYAYFWHFVPSQPGLDTNQLNPVVSFNATDSVSVQLVVSNFGQCWVGSNQHKFKPELGSDGLIAKFTLGPKTGEDLCSPNRQIVNTSKTGYDTYTFNFDGGNFLPLGTSQVINALSPGYHLVRMAVTKGTCSDTASLSFNISEPIIDYTVTASSCNKLVVLNNQSYSTDGTPLNYQWSFGIPQQGGSNERSPVFAFANAGTDSITLLASSVSGCFKALRKPVAISSGNTTYPVDFTFYKALTTCNNRYQFVNTTPVDTALRFTWYYHDGSTDYRYHSGKSYGDTGTYQVRLLAAKGTCFDLTQKQVSLTAPLNGVVAAFTVNKTQQPVNNQSFNFFNSSYQVGSGNLGANKGKWDFADGTQDTVNAYIFDKRYAQPGIYDVMYVLSAGANCADSAFARLEVQALPFVRFNFSKPGCAGRTVQFRDSSILATSHFWEFGDGNTSNLASPAHTYASDGYYKIKLTINGNVTDSNYLLVASTPDASFTKQGNACLNRFELNANALGNGLDYLWTLSKPYPFNETAKQTTLNITQADTVTLQLRVVSYGLCSAYSAVETIYAQSGLLARASLATSDLCNNSRILTDLSTQATQTQYYLNGDLAGKPLGSFTVLTGLPEGDNQIKVVAENAVCKDTAIYNFVISDITGNYNAQIDPCRSKVLFEPIFKFASQTSAILTWDFGDGKQVTDFMPLHYYGVADTYLTTARITLSNGCTKTFSQTIQVKDSSQIPSTFTYNAVSGGLCKTGINFVPSSPLAKEVKWNFGDGFEQGPEPRANAFHAYQTVGSYKVVLTSYDSIGCASVSDTVIIPVLQTGSQPPVARFEANDTAQCLSLQNFNFQNNSFINGVGSITNWLWTFGDGNVDNSSFSVNNYRYDSVGIYTLKLRVTTNAGCSDSTSRVIRVKADKDCFLGLDPSAEAKASFMAYPNPTQGSITLQWKGNITVQGWQLTDLLGKEVGSGMLENASSGSSLNFEQIANGNYILRLNTREGEVLHTRVTIYK